MDGRTSCPLPGRPVLERATRGETPALERVLQRCEPLVRGYIRKRTRNFHETQDLVQETFLQVLCSLHRIRSPDRFLHWITKIAYHVTVDWRRRRSCCPYRGAPLHRVEDEEMERAILRNGALGRLECRLDRNVAVRKVAQALRALPEDYTVVLVLHYLEELSCREIGALLRIKPNNVKIRLFRARNLLRERLAPFEDELLACAGS